MDRPKRVTKPWESACLRVRISPVLVALVASKSTIAIGVEVPTPVTQEYIESVFCRCDKPLKAETRLCVSLPLSYYQRGTTLGRHEIDTINSQSWLNLEFQLISANTEETANHDANIFCGSLAIERNVYSRDAIVDCLLPTCQQSRCPLAHVITRDPRITNWMECSRQLCCSGTIILFQIYVEDFGLLFCPWQLACVGSKPTASSLPISERRNQMLTDVLASNSRNKVPAKPQSRNWQEGRRIMNTWMRFRLIRNGSTNQYSCLYCANLAPCCCVITKSWNSNTGVKHDRKICIEKSGDALPGCDEFDISPDVADVPCILVAVLWVPLLVLAVLRQAFVHETQRCNTNSETVVCGWCSFWSWTYCDHWPKLQLLIPNQGVRPVKSQSQRKRKKSRDLLDWMVTIIITSFFCQSYTFAWTLCTDIRNNMSHYPCIDYDVDHSLFTMTCSFLWNDPTECIILRANETFEGNGHSVNLTGINDWSGLFRIADSSNEGGGPSSLKDAPIIHDVHMIGGETSIEGGFIIRSFQKHFIVKHCSSSGVINDWSVGGICGAGCFGDILITRCWSSGEIRGAGAGGIAGAGMGHDSDEDNTVTISHCHSTGDILGTESGGICGYRTGSRSNIMIKQCYSLGDIGGSRSGGITGGRTADNGHVSISNCYSRGDITGLNYAGGICGRDTGVSKGTVVLTNVYASGKIMVDDHAGGLVGNIPSNAKQVNITMSVYDGSEGNMTADGSDATENGILTEKQNSGDLEAIIGTVYCYGDHGEEDCWDTDTIWQAVDNGLPILLPLSLPPPSPTSSTSPSPTLTPTASYTTTPSSTDSRTPSVTSSSTPTGSSTPSLAILETGTWTCSGSPTHSLTGTWTARMTSTASTSPAPTGRPKRLPFTQLPVQRPRRRVVNRRG